MSDIFKKKKKNHTTKKHFPKKPHKKINQPVGKTLYLFSASHVCMITSKYIH